ncbi:LTA synthase family protein [Pseudothauera hydrothermalis]|uniref:LTA synthase family protein n=1 Tax=Pseudothauera hydrothermalis TaxID=2184083 RepID=UPI001315378A|nr:sulfatase-like hydrolase/transferase [Pseudothauera hydrothermalis]
MKRLVRPLRARGATVGLWCACLLVGLFAWLAWQRTVLVDRIFGSAIGCSGCLTTDVLLHDALLLGGACLAGIVGISALPRFLGLILRGLALLCAAMYWGDLATLTTFNTRLRISDILIYGAQPDVVLRHLHTTGQINIGSVLGACGLLAAVFFYLFLPRWASVAPRKMAGLLVFPATAIIIGFSVPPRPYVHDWGVRNVLAANFDIGVAQPYSDGARIAAEGAPPSEPVCAAGVGFRGDIVLLILESWSPYQSMLFGGIRDWTPGLDSFALRHGYHTQMHAAGFTTNEGLMSLLAGVEFLSPVKPFSKIGPFETAWGLENTLPKVLHGLGYHTAFLTSGDLAFSRKGAWLADIGFDYVEGHDHPIYNNHPRLHFGAAADEVLYERAKQYLFDRQAQDRPVLLVIESVSSHHPYIHPLTREASQEAAFRYMDASAAKFLGDLEDAGFLKRGHIIVASDHRAMIPITREEISRFGRGAASRIPMIWAGPKLPRGEHRVLVGHQADMIDSIKWLAAEQFCSERQRPVLFAPAADSQTTGRCAFHARGDDRDVIDVFCPNGGEGSIKLRGDQTRFQSKSGLDAEQTTAIVAWVNRYRILAEQRGAHTPP